MMRFDRSTRRGLVPRMRSWRLLRWSLGITSLALVGCGRPDEPFTRVAIDGSVTLDSRPLESASIRFVPTGTTSGPKTSFDVRDGRFVACTRTGPPVGTHRVEIESVDPAWWHDDEEAVERLRKARAGRITRERLPDRYHTHSSLTVTLTEPDPNSAGDSPQILTFDLSSRLP
jgi:hypothetical protein